MYDLKKRSIAKGISWRILATIDTFFISLFFLNKIIIALPIALTEIFSKMFLYYIHERIWNSIQWGRKENIPTNIRSLAKAISWRLIGSTDTFLLSLLYSGNLRLSINISITEIFSKIIAFYLHERIWSHIKWGRIFDQQPSSLYTPKIKSI